MHKACLCRACSPDIWCFVGVGTSPHRVHTSLIMPAVPPHTRAHTRTLTRHGLCVLCEGVLWRAWVVGWSNVSAKLFNRASPSSSPTAFPLVLVPHRQHPGSH